MTKVVIFFVKKIKYFFLPLHDENKPFFTFYFTDSLDCL